MKTKWLLAIAACSMFASCNKEQVDLSGAGATFPQPYYNLAFKNIQEKINKDAANEKVTISYGGIGSGGGTRSLKSQVADFAGSDAFVSDDEQKEMPATVHIPTCLGAVVMSYNLKDVKDLKLTSSLISKIYLGKITKWNDAEIAAVNPDITLPDKAITPVYRSDGSGTTFNFSDFMTKSDPQWALALGSGKSLNFSVGVSGKGNPGVAGIIEQTEGSIGYIGSEYAFAQNLPIASIQNSNGKFIMPNEESISLSADGYIPDDLRYTISNSSVKGAYPMSCLTWIVVYKEQAYANRSEKKSEALVNLLYYMLSQEAQSTTSKVNYAPLPDKVIKKARKAISTMTYNGKEIEATYAQQEI